MNTSEFIQVTDDSGDIRYVAVAHIVDVVDGNNQEIHLSDGRTIGTKEGATEVMAKIISRVGA